MFECKLLVLLVAVSSYVSLAKPPPGFAPERDKDVSKYKYEYSVLDGLGAHSGRVESRDGPHTLGGYFVSVPMGHGAMGSPLGPTSLQQTVSYITDSWGYHPIVSYTTNHGQAVTTAQFAMGSKAVAALRQQEEQQAQQLQQAQQAQQLQQQQHQQQQQSQQAAVAETVASGEPGEAGVPSTSLLAPAAPLPTPSATLVPPPALLAVGADGPAPSSTPATPAKALLPGLLDLGENSLYKTEAELGVNDIGLQGAARGSGVQVTSFLADTNAADQQQGQRAAGDGPKAAPSLKGADSISAYVISESDERGTAGNVLEASTAAPPPPPAPTTLKPIVVSETFGSRVPSTTPSYSLGSTVTVTPESSSGSSTHFLSSLGTTAADSDDALTDTASTPTVVITPRPATSAAGQHQDGAQQQQQVAAASNAFEVTDDGHQYLEASAGDDTDDGHRHQGDEELQREQQQLQDNLKKDMTIHKSSAVHEAHYRTEVEVQKSVEVPSDITLDAVKVADDEHVMERGPVHAPAYYISRHQQLLRQQEHLRELEKQQREQQEQQEQARQLQEQQQEEQEQVRQLQEQQQEQREQQEHQEQARELQEQQHERARELRGQLLNQELQEQQQIQDAQPELLRVPPQDSQLQLQDEPQDLDLQQSVADTQPHHVQLLQPLALQLPYHMQAHFLHQAPGVFHEALLLQPQQHTQQQPQIHAEQTIPQPPPPQQQQIFAEQSLLQPPPQELQEQLIHHLPPHLSLQQQQQLQQLPANHAPGGDAPALPEENKLQLEALVQQVAADVTRLVRVEDPPASTKLVEVEKQAAPAAPAPPQQQQQQQHEQVTRLVMRPFSHPFMTMQYHEPHGVPMHHLLPFQHYIALPIKDLQLSESQVQQQHQPHQQLHHKYKISHEDEITATSHKAVPGIDPDKIVHCAEHVYSFRPYPAHWKSRAGRRGGLGGPGGAAAPGRHRGNLRKLCIEYGGFKPPLVPSTPIKEDGKPVHPSNDD